MKKFYITILTALLPMLVFSQGENDNWYFGGNAAVNFSNPALPAALTNSQMPLTAVSGSVSDSSGQLLFYTNGNKVYSRDHQVMQNGTMQNGAVWSISIAQHPANTNLYYLFMVKTRDVNNSTADPEFLTYSIIDMSQGNLINGQPAGVVVGNAKEVIIFGNYQSTNFSPATTIVKHSDGQSFWLITHNETKLYSYLVNSQGVAGTPVSSNLSFTQPTTSTLYSTAIKSSPTLSGGSFSNYLFMSMWHGTPTSKVMSYNNSTGMITGQYEITISSQYPTVGEFNRNASILYIGRNYDSKMFAVDLQNSVSSPVYQQIYNNTDPNFECTGLQRNRYGDVYVAFSGYSYLSKITNPDTYGSSTVDLNSLYLAGKNTYYKLPEFVNTFGPECLNNKTLTTPETSANHTYQVSDYIITQDAYEISSGQNIHMKAGNSITFRPDTFIKSGAVLLAEIKACGSVSRQEKRNTDFSRPVSLKIDLDKPDQMITKVEVYPNPVSDVLTIQSSSVVENINIYDLSGKKVAVSLSGKTVDVKNIPAGAYLITIETKDGKITKKFIKK